MLLFLPLELNKVSDTPVMKYLRTAFVALLFACSTAASAQDDQARRDVAELVELSGLSTIIQSVPRNMADSISNGIRRGR